MNKIILLCQSYPNPLTGDVGSAFVHVRAKEYATKYNIEVIKISSVESSYNYEGITVTCLTDLPSFRIYFDKAQPKAVLAHFCEQWMNETAILKNTPLIVWVHGSEAHAWYRILFNVHYGNIMAFAKFMLINMLSLRNFRRMIKNSNSNKKIHFVFVSEWMKRITFFDTFSSTSNYSIIPNPINTTLFDYIQKQPELRKKILMLRSFNSSKYANDVAVDAIIKLSEKNYFNDLEFTIYGKGVHWNKLTSGLKKFPNVILINKLIPQAEIPALHKQFGIFLCPTRMDAQGVSMCEAMSSGLVPITSNNTAIPEFVIDKVSGFLTHSSSEIADKIDYLYLHPDVFCNMSEKASELIQQKCDINTIIEKEISLIDNMIQYN